MLNENGYYYIRRRRIKNVHKAKPYCTQGLAFSLESAEHAPTQIKPLPRGAKNLIKARDLAIVTHTNEGPELRDK